MDIDKLLELLTASPEIANGIITGAVEKYKPILYMVLRECFNVYKDLVNNDEYFAVSAKYDRKKFDALLNEGFTEDQALSIMLYEAKQLKESARKSSGSSSVKLNK